MSTADTLTPIRCAHCEVVFDAELAATCRVCRAEVCEACWERAVCPRAQLSLLER